jgi:hypothetical protein
VYWILNFFLIRIVGGGVRLGPFCTSANWSIVSAPRYYENGEFGGMMIGRGNRSTRRKPIPVPLCPSQIYWILEYIDASVVSTGNVFCPGISLTCETRVSCLSASSMSCITNSWNFKHRRRFHHSGEDLMPGKRLFKKRRAPCSSPSMSLSKVQVFSSQS